MVRHKSKLFLVFALLAVFSFVVISTGGEFFHGKIHHHQTKSSHDECLISQLQAESSIVLFAIVLIVFFRSTDYLAKVSNVFFPQLQYTLPCLRAPPLNS